jgi:large subunit ribosomal protein L22
MGARKRKAAEARKEALKKIAYAKLNNTPTSPRKMRLVADMIRGKRIELALNLLRFSTKEAAGRLEKLLLSAINNWQAKNEGERMEDHNLIVSEIFVDEGRSLKRLRPAPQGRGYRIRKRSNHVTIVLDSLTAREQTTTTAEQTETTEQNA